MDAAASISRAGALISRAVGFAPTASSVDAGWRSATLYAWRGYAEECQFPSMDEPIVVFHTGGAAKVPVVKGAYVQAASQPGLFTLVPPGTPIRWQISGEVHSFSAHLASRCFDRLLDQNVAALFDRLELRCAFADELLGGLFKALASEVGLPTQMGSLYVDALADSMALHLLRTSPAAAPPCTERAVAGLSEQAFRRITDRIEACLESGVSLQALADEVGMSRAHFATIFRKTTGISPHRYLTRRRVSLARALLLQSETPISDVALHCGFSSQAHFTEYFRRTTGLTPAAFRRQGSSRH